MVTERLYVFVCNKDGVCWPEEACQELSGVSIGVPWREVQEFMSEHHYDMSEHHKKVGLDWKTKTEEEYFSE